MKTKFKDFIKKKEKKRINKINKIYNFHSEKFTDSHSKVGWNSKKSQEIRWGELLNIGFKNGDSILDFGCGFGVLYNYINKRYDIFTYYGVDINDNFIKSAKKINPDVFYKKINTINDIDFKYDWFIASGVFTVHTTTKNLIDTIQITCNQCNKGVSFNLMNDLHYNDIDEVDNKYRGYNKNKIYKEIKKHFKNFIYTKNN